MTVTALDIGKTVRWTEGDRVRTGTLTRVREPGTPGWYGSHGKALVLVTVDERHIPVEGYRQWADVRPGELEVVDDEEAASDARS